MFQTCVCTSVSQCNVWTCAVSLLSTIHLEAVVAFLLEPSSPHVPVSPTMVGQRHRAPRGHRQCATCTVCVSVLVQEYTCRSSYKTTIHFHQHYRSNKWTNWCTSINSRLSSPLTTFTTLLTPSTLPLPPTTPHLLMLLQCLCLYRMIPAPSLTIWTRHSIEGTVEPR